MAAQQLDLFGEPVPAPPPPPIVVASYVRRHPRQQARQDDPDTSHIAAEEHERTGAAVHHRQRVLDCVRDHPGETAALIGERTGLGHVEAQRRLSDLKANGAVEMGARKRCPLKGTQMRTWWPVEAQ